MSRETSESVVAIAEWKDWCWGIGRV